MIKDVFNLKKNAWHSKLMNFTWGYTHRDFSHICPYFWLSILNVIMFPITFLIKNVIIGLGKLLGELLVKISDSLINYMDSRPDKWEKREIWEDRFIENLKKGDGLESFIKLDLDLKCNGKFNDIFNKIYHYRDSHRDLYAKILALREKYFAEQEKKKDQYHAEIKALTIKNKQKITKMVNIFKPIAVNIIYLAAGFSLAFVGLGLYELGILLYNVGVWIFNLHFNIDWNTFFLLIGVIIGVVISVVLLVVVLDFIRNKFNNCCECRQKLLNFFSYFKYLKYLGYPVYYVYKFFELLWVMLKDNCPAIKWED